MRGAATGYSRLAFPDHPRAFGGLEPCIPHTVRPVY